MYSLLSTSQLRLRHLVTGCAEGVRDVLAKCGDESRPCFRRVRRRNSMRNLLYHQSFHQKYCSDQKCARRLARPLVWWLFDWDPSWVLGNDELNLYA